MVVERVGKYYTWNADKKQVECYEIEMFYHDSDKWEQGGTCMLRVCIKREKECGLYVMLVRQLGGRRYIVVRKGGEESEMLVMQGKMLKRPGYVCLKIWKRKQELF